VNSQSFVAVDVSGVFNAGASRLPQLPQLPPPLRRRSDAVADRYHVLVDVLKIFQLTELSKLRHELRAVRGVQRILVLQLRNEQREERALIG
jgi:hypothetical protein